MKRALVWKSEVRDYWWADLRDAEDLLLECATFPTHAEALHAALEAVGLTPANPEPMEAP